MEYFGVSAGVFVVFFSLFCCLGFGVFLWKVVGFAYNRAQVRSVKAFISSLLLLLELLVFPYPTSDIVNAMTAGA